MEILLIGGAPQTGKSTFLYRLAQRLVATGRYTEAGAYAFPAVMPMLYEPFRIWEDLKIKDEMFFLTGTNPNGIQKKILINMASDNLDCINNLMQKISDLSQLYTIDVLVTSIRCPFDDMRTELIDRLALNEQFPVEIPLGKKHWAPGIHQWLDWYLATTDNLIFHTLQNRPYDI